MLTVLLVFVRDQRTEDSRTPTFWLLLESYVTMHVCVYACMYDNALSYN